MLVIELKICKSFPYAINEKRTHQLRRYSTFCCTLHNTYIGVNISILQYNLLLVIIGQNKNKEQRASNNSIILCGVDLGNSNIQNLVI